MKRCILAPKLDLICDPGAHDNGYISTLNYLQNEGHLQKIIILRSNKELASELKSLDLPTLAIDGLFLRKKLQSINKNNNSKLLTNKKTPTAIIQAQDFEKFRSKSTLYTLNTTQSSSPTNKDARQLEPGVVCIFFLTSHSFWVVTDISPSSLCKDVGYYLASYCFVELENVIRETTALQLLLPCRL